MTHLNDIIKRATEEFEKISVFANQQVTGYVVPFPEAQSFLASAIREAIATAFKETEISGKDFRFKVSPDHSIEGEEYTDGFNAALAEVKRRQEEFLKK